MKCIILISIVIISQARSYTGADETKSLENSGDKSFSFSYATDDLAHEQASDADGNVKGRYSYTNEAGNHDLSYEAGPEKGFIVTGGSLAEANGLTKSGMMPMMKKMPEPKMSESKIRSMSNDQQPDGAYRYSYETDDSAHEQSSDADGNVMGKYSYTNDAGMHDLMYRAGPNIGFIVTGGSLAEANGLSKSAMEMSAMKMQGEMMKTAPAMQMKQMNPDGSYSFSYASDDSAREESSDAAGYVMGKYSYSNDAGMHDLTYEAGPEIGFMVTGGSLAEANGLLKGEFKTKFQPADAMKSLNVMTKSAEDQPMGDKSYSFSYSSDNSAREETSDAEGNVMGMYSYTDETGQHGMTYKAGPGIGFMPTGGSLTMPPTNFATLIENTGDESSLFQNSETKNKPGISSRIQMEPLEMSAAGNMDEASSIKYDNGLVLRFLKSNPKNPQNSGFMFSKMN